MYERFVNQLKEYLRTIKILSKGYLPISLLLPSKLAKILHEVKQMLLKTNKNYGLVIKGMYKYYDMKLVTFGIDQNRNLIIQFSHLCTTLYAKTADSIPSRNISSSNTRYE